MSDDRHASPVGQWGVTMIKLDDETRPSRLVEDMQGRETSTLAKKIIYIG